MAKKLLSILFLIVFLIASVGVAVNKHYCGGKLKDIGLTVLDSKSCCGEEEMPEDCCQNEIEYHHLKEGFHKTPSLTIHLVPDLAIAFFTSYFDFFQFSEHQTGKFFQHKPPLLDRDIPVLIQSFLI